MFNSINKKIKILISLLTFSSLLIMINGINLPTLLVYVNLFSQSFFNIQFGFVLLSVCYLVFNHYEKELTQQDIGIVVVVCILLMLISFMVNNTFMSIKYGQIVYPHLWSYLIDIVVLCVFYLLRKKYCLSWCLTFMIYSILGIVIILTRKTLYQDIQLNILIYAFVYLAILLWLKKLVDVDCYSKREWLCIGCISLVVGILAMNLKTDVSILLCVHLAILLMIGAFKQFLKNGKLQVYGFVMLGFVLLVNYHYICNYDALMSQGVFVNVYTEIIKIGCLFIITLLMLTIKREQSMKLIMSGLVLSIIYSLVTQFSVRSMDVLSYMMQACSIGYILGMIERKIKLSYIVFAFVTMMFIMIVVIVALPKVLY